MSDRPPIHFRIGERERQINIPPSWVVSNQGKMYSPDSKDLFILCVTPSNKFKKVTTFCLFCIIFFSFSQVPKESLIYGLSFIMKLSQRIQLRSSDETASTLRRNEDANHFHKTFPFFIWLLRDVVLALPKDCHNIKDYFLTRVSKKL